MDCLVTNEPVKSRRKRRARPTKHHHHHSSGQDGKDGYDGRDGRDAPTLEQILKALAPYIPEPVKGDAGRDGRDAPTESEIVSSLLSQIKMPQDGRKGEQGPIGPMPKHQVERGRIRFETSVGVWGDWIKLPRGRTGNAGPTGEKGDSGSGGGSNDYAELVSGSEGINNLGANKAFTDVNPQTRQAIHDNRDKIQEILVMLRSL